VVQYARKKWHCQRVVRIDEMIQAFFKCTEREQEELMIINIIAKPDRYVEGKYYWFWDESAFPH
jgi:hypothetical protein